MLIPSQVYQNISYFIRAWFAPIPVPFSHSDSLQFNLERLTICFGAEDGAGVMTDIKGDRLYVNLGANQARRRVKGHGFGVKKVYSDGRNRAVIIHTATGQHRDELHALFADVIFTDKTDNTDKL